MDIEGDGEGEGGSHERCNQELHSCHSGKGLCVKTRGAGGGEQGAKEKHTVRGLRLRTECHTMLRRVAGDLLEMGVSRWCAFTSKHAHTDLFRGGERGGCEETMRTTGSGCLCSSGRWD